ncbi:rhamnogalacturonan acetylesterase [Hymenobacter cellulosilyticus]|uniref:Rhamnogalacturonan acetylesterase n=1 Tax=Hymenobacter cellulosilyticus TaxID=2932248 RepID=A0A8T9PZ98_9BACT|nr:rhamnogalacturonan acetylesterase [Hymenobacter cellulosilyticus]UOQ70417.1 rhamnogalacturonan acetylesterase [Hymenobacter cellulosilyticus]
MKFIRTALILLLGLSLLTAFLPRPKARPTLFLIGDSTVKNGKGRGDGGLWGWGSFLPAHFDTTRITVENYALGGTSSRTFRSQGHWAKVLPRIKAGDYVIMQFGHNDSSPVNDSTRARGTIKSNGEETQEIVNLLTKQPETVHSYGWYLRQFIAEIKAKGATPIVCSPIPRNAWTAGKVTRNSADYGRWAAEAARQGGASFLDLNLLAANHYDQLGEAAVRSTYFNATDHTHTIEAGARRNAQAVAEGIRELKNLALRKYLRKS